MAYGFTITSAGWHLLAKLLAGDTLELSRVMVGSGRLADGESPAQLTDLVAPVTRAEATEPVIDGRTVSFVVEYRSDLDGGLEEGFWLNEFGVYALDPDGGEVLLYYGTLGDYPQYVSAYSSGAVDVRRFPVSIALTDELQVVFTHPPLAFMTAQEVADYVMTTALPLFLEETDKKIAAHNAAEGTHQDIRNLVDTELESRVQRLEDMVFNDINTYPFSVGFADLDGLVVTGVWNQAQQRIEF